MDSYTPLLVIPAVIVILYFFRRRRNSGKTDFITSPTNNNKMSVPAKGKVLLCKVEEVLKVDKLGIVITPGPQNFVVNNGANIKLLRPDGSVIHTKIKGQDRHSKSILIGPGFIKDDVPPGTEVWLDE